MGELSGRTVLVTGANTGIGRVTAIELARRGARVHLACRSEEKARPVVEEIRAIAGPAAAEILPLDLASLESVRTAAARFLDRGEPLHVLVCNAGVGGQRGATREGFEIHFGVNHLGHFLFVDRLLPRLRESAPARVVVVSSRAHYRARRIDFDALRRPTKSLTGFPEYAVSKLCNVLFARALARRLEGSGVTTYALHPGVIASDIWRRVPSPFRSLLTAFMTPVEEGARTTVWCATAPELATATGRYYDDCREKRPSALARDDALAERLWERSAQWADEQAR